MLNLFFNFKSCSRILIMRFYIKASYNKIIKNNVYSVYFNFYHKFSIVNLIIL